MTGNLVWTDLTLCTGNQKYVVITGSTVGTLPMLSSKNVKRVSSFGLRFINYDTLNGNLYSKVHFSASRLKGTLIFHPTRTAIVFLEGL